MAQPFFLPVEIFRQTLLFHQVEKLVDEFSWRWHDCSADDLPLVKIYAPAEQQEREAHLDLFMQTLQEERKQEARFEDVEMQERIFAHIRAFFKYALGFRPAEVDLILDLGFKESTKKFLHLARQFDAAMAPADIFQACRNVWIMNGLQLMLGLKVRLTPAIFAYSMLYPYTDNYLDSAAIPKEEKIAFNDRFARRLAGGNVAPTNEHERIVFSLIEKIEGDFDRSRFPLVFESLLAIHQAQTKSVLLLGSVELAQKDVLRISLEKGGTSVLADGYLVAGRLTDAQAAFLFGYGAYLQFLDDLQDVYEDERSGQRSIYTLAVQTTSLDLITTQTFDFGERVLASQQGFTGRAVKGYTDLMRTSIQLMLLEAVGFAGKYFTPGFISKIEKYSPFRFSHLKALKDRHAPYYMSMFGRLI
ncbi:hypothetical protein JW998_18020 [candidate division KSB1 bacterium]|nr:hypothetical protein [candidate division KSB1 bacterium]